jgi:hypothetical protein
MLITSSAISFFYYKLLKDKVLHVVSVVDEFYMSTVLL